MNNAFKINKPDNPDKPFLTYDEQLIKLKRDYKIKDSGNLNLEKEILMTLSYYDLANGCKEFHSNNNQNITLIDLYEFIIFDKKIQTILSSFSIYVENTFKTKLAYLISKTRGVKVEEYLNFKTYQSNSKRKEKLKSTLKDLENISITTFDNPIKHYRDKHNHIPAWILFKNTYFNTVIDLFNFLKREEKLELINEYDFFNNNLLTEDIKIELFKNMITIVRKFRNKIVHNNKIMNLNLEKVQIIQKEFKKIDIYSMIKSKDIYKKRGANDIYSMLITILYFLNNDILRKEFCKNLTNLLSEDLSLTSKYLTSYNYPANLLNRLQEANTTINTFLTFKH